MEVTLALLATSLASCAKEATGPVATTPIAPVSASVTVSPAPGAAAVAPGDSVMVTFNYGMDSASCASRFALRRGDSSGVMVPGRMSWDTAYRRMAFVPDSMLAPGTTYYVQLRDSMMTRQYMMADSAMGGSGMGGMGGMGGTGSGQHLMPGSPMMFDQPPAGASRTGSGMQWSFKTAG